MKTIGIFAEAVKFASEASDIPSGRILSESRDADVVDARMLVIQTLYDIGLYPRRIAVTLSTYIGLCHAESVRRTLNVLSVVSAYPRTTSRIRNKFATIRCRAMFDKKKRLHDMCNPFSVCGGVVLLSWDQDQRAVKSLA